MTVTSVRMHIQSRCTESSQPDSHSSSVLDGSSWPSSIGASCLLRIAFLTDLLLSALALAADLLLLEPSPMLPQGWLQSPR